MASILLSSSSKRALRPVLPLVVRSMRSPPPTSSSIIHGGLGGPGSRPLLLQLLGPVKQKHPSVPVPSRGYSGYCGVSSSIIHGGLGGPGSSPLLLQLLGPVKQKHPSVPVPPFGFGRGFSTGAKKKRCCCRVCKRKIRVVVKRVPVPHYIPVVQMAIADKVSELLQHSRAILGLLEKPKEQKKEEQKKADTKIPLLVQILYFLFGFHLFVLAVSVFFHGDKTKFVNFLAHVFVDWVKSLMQLVRLERVLELLGLTEEDFHANVAQVITTMGSSAAKLPAEFKVQYSALLATLKSREKVD